MNTPRLYATFLLWLLSELFEKLPEVGDLDKPKLVFLFDEAHLLFNGARTAVLDQIERVTRLIRSKGVGVYYVTQSPADVPDRISAQLGNRIQHALRAFTPKEQKAVRSAAQTFRKNPISTPNAPFRSCKWARRWFPSSTTRASPRSCNARSCGRHSTATMAPRPRTSPIYG